MTLIPTNFFSVSAPQQAPTDACGVSTSTMTTLSEDELDLVSGNGPKGGWSLSESPVSAC